MALGKGEALQPAGKFHSYVAITNSDLPLERGSMKHGNINDAATYMRLD